MWDNWYDHSAIENIVEHLLSSERIIIKFLLFLDDYVGSEYEKFNNLLFYMVLKFA